MLRSERVKEGYLTTSYCSVMGFLCAALLIISYPKFNLGFLAWAAFAPFAMGVQSLKKSSSAFSFGVYTGFVFYCGILYWIYFTCRAGGVNPILSFLAWIGLSAILASLWGIFGWAVFLMRGSGAMFPLLAAMCWAGLEIFSLALAKYAVWFPWFLLGYTQWKYTHLIQIVSVIKTTGLGFIIAYAGLSLGYCLHAKKLKPLIAPLGMIAAIFIYGVTKNPPPSADFITAAILQPNIDQYKKWDEKFVLSIEETLTRLLNTAEKSKPQLVVWPESALPGWVEDPRYKDWLKSLAVKMNCWHLVGSVSNVGEKYVSAYLENGQGVLNAGGVRFGAAICYESIFPYLWRERDAKFFINITNDGWYLKTAGPYQHFVPNIFRALETGKPVLRAANTGISALIDGQGKIQYASKLGTEGVYILKVYYAH
ncbi:MAG: hypothetical protein NTW04_05105 [Elusimicrobia bacterium]|nr:hypothetical protein [Elusimicrobiota bacterium]